MKGDGPLVLVGLLMTNRGGEFSTYDSTLEGVLK